MHTNRWLYKQFHSVHHRLYVPYAFGALYNHPLEGFLLDTCGAGLAEWIAHLSTREAMLLFAVSTLKTVDDHCGYRLALDPLQLLFGNNADYHDIHHQVCHPAARFLLMQQQLTVFLSFLRLLASKVISHNRSSSIVIHSLGQG